MATSRNTRRRAPRPLTARDVQQRARAAGITLPEGSLEGVTAMMNNALAPVRGLDTTQERTIEPAVTFQA
jgi:hypothetical protein